MKIITSFFLFFISISLFAQSDDYCPCLDVPNYFTNSYLDSLSIDDLVAFPSLESSEAAYPVLVSESFFANDEDMNTPVELFMEQPINLSPSDLYKKVNVSPEETKMEKQEVIEEELELSAEAEEEEPKIKQKVMKQKRRKRMRKLKKRKKARKYRGKCPSFIP